MTRAKATRFINRLAEVRKLGYPKLFITCSWENRRFVIESCAIEPPPIANEDIIVIDTNVEIDKFVNEIIKFGAQREYYYRNRKKDDIENVLSADDMLIHLVPAYSHIALCKHKSSLWSSALRYTPDPEIWCPDCGAAFRERDE
jgi:hypothetical protein